MANRRVSVTVDADVSPFVRGLTGAGVAAKGFAHELESADGRMANLVQSGMALAPALIPIGAAAVPAIAGLTAQLGFAVTAAGVTVLAFQGVGDALKALNDYQIDPTAEHLQKLNETMDALGPAGVNFVHFLQQIRPELQDLQDVAQQGLLPGMEDGIRELMVLAPQAERIIGHIATTLGDLLSKGGDNLNDARWVEFFDFLDQEAGPTLTAMGQTLGNVVEGLANMMMAFDPMADDFTNGMVRYSQAFAQWTEGLDSSQGFQSFVDYVRTNGPEAMHTLGALADALVSLVTAAAPVGSSLLPVIADLADGLSAIAESPVGPVLITTAAAIGTLGRSLALLKAVGLRGGTGDSIMSKVLGTEKIKAGISPLVEITRATKDLSVAQRAQAFAAVTQSDAVKKGAVQFGKNAVAMGGLAFAASGLAEKTGLANTASLGLMGTLAGPWGVAVLGGTGLIMDFKRSADHSAESVAAWNDQLSRGVTDVASYASVLSDLKSRTDALANQVVPHSLIDQLVGSVTDPETIKMNLHAIFGDLDSSALGRNSAAYAELQSQYDDLVLALNQVGQAVGDIQWGEAVTDLDQLNGVIAKVQPAMQALGITYQDLIRGVQDGSITGMIDDLVGWTERANSAEGRTEALAASFRKLDNDMGDTAQSASDVAKALDDLLSPQMNLSEATDQWTTALRHLEDDLAKNNKSLRGNTDAAIQNRAAIRDRVRDIEAVLSAEAAAGASSAELSVSLRRQRQALIDAGVAAHMSRGELKDYLNELGLTPHVVKTIIQANTTSAMRDLAEARRQLELFDGSHYQAIMELHTVRTGPGGQGAGYENNAEGGYYPEYALAAGGLCTPLGAQIVTSPLLEAAA